MKSKHILHFILALALVVIVLAAYKAYLWYGENKKANFGKEATIYVYPGQSSDDVLNAIADSALVINRQLLERAFADKQVARYIKPGRYVVTPSCSSVYVARMLNNGWQTPVPMVLSGTMRTKESIARKISNQMLVDSTEMIQALNDNELLGLYGFNTDNIFNLIIPDTYEMYWTSGVDDILSRLKSVYDGYWTEDRVQKAKAQGLTKEQAGILASIVGSETNYVPEMPAVAAVYLNRLRIGMRLQADPTVAFCFDYKLKRVLNKHLEYDSPYNTYLYSGLPPGPIAVAPKECIEAVLNPIDCNYLYFCAKPDFSGTHVFASSYAEHLKNAAQFQRALNGRR